MKPYYLYIMTTGKRGTLYIDITDNLMHSVKEYKSKLKNEKNKKNSEALLVYFEKVEDILKVHQRKKAITEMGKWVENYINRNNKSRMERSLS